MKNEVFRRMVKTAYYTVAAVLAALIVFLCINAVFPGRSGKKPNAGGKVKNAFAEELQETPDTEGKDAPAVLSMNTQDRETASAALPDAVYAVSSSVAGETEEKAVAPADELAALDLTEEENTGRDPDGDEPPSLLEIFFRSVLSYKSLLSHEMPFIYGTEHIAANAEHMMEEEMAPEEISEEIKLEISRIEQEPGGEVVLGGTGAQVLIYHTHTQEAYRQVPDSEYVEVGRWRTKDTLKSVVMIGSLLQKELDKYGFNVLHSKENHEPPDLNSSYSRSLKTMKKYLAKNKSIRVFIDIHRDASSDKDDVVIIDGKRCARIMFVVGMGKSSSIKPDWKQTYKLAKAVTDKMEAIKKGFTRKVRVKEVRSYNQYMSDLCLLIEVGHNGNTLEEAKNTVPYLAKAISQVITVNN